MVVKCFKIECLTNMHVGNGDVNFNIIDNEVEKDPVLETPTINASGIKGALREHFTSLGCDKINDFFGTSQNSKDGTDFGQGKIKILSANLLAIPMRASDSKAFYYLVSNDEILSLFDKLNLSFGIKGLEIDRSAKDEVNVEGKNCRLTINSSDVVKSQLALMDTKDFKSIPLPVVARNHINGGSNLWYEEIVPHKSVFYFYAISNDKELMNSFAEILCKYPVQFGGNASIGYGMTIVSEIGGSCDE